MDSVFKAIADPTRREILTLLVKGPASVNELSEQFNMSRPGVTKHIKILQESRLVDMRMGDHDNRQRICYAQLEALEEVQEYISTLEKFWKKRLNSLGQYLDKTK